MIVGGYSLDLYCDYGDKSMSITAYHGYREGTAHFDASSQAAANRIARKAGWKIVGSKCYCPKHAKSSEPTPKGNHDSCQGS